MSESEVVLELPGLRKHRERCRRTRCRGAGAPTGRLLGWQNFPDKLTWYVEWVCPKCRTRETIGSAKIDMFGSRVSTSPDTADELTQAFVDDVRRSGWA